ncbi:MAG: hypothetical protein L0Z07_09860 [Planctomycetes bacterium]|nr:hypothetical protein [Planctomycetota bacterium]
MKRSLVALVAAAATMAVASNLAAFEITIEVAPSVVSLDSQGQVVTVHTDIAYGAVDGWSVALDGLTIQSWKADNQGNYVAKFNLDDVKDMLKSKVGTEVVVTLTGETKDGEEFEGSDTIKVVKPRK